jgi:hypothetical protein
MDFDNIPNMVVPGNYDSFINGELPHYFGNEHPIILFDDLGGFDSSLNNKVINYLKSVNCNKPIATEYIISDEMKKLWSPLDISVSVDLKNNADLKYNHGYTTHPEIQYDNFLCSFNNSINHGRELLTSSLKKFGLFDETYCSKYFKSGEFYLWRILQDIKSTNVVCTKFFTHNNEFLSNDFVFKNNGWDFELESSEPYGFTMMRKNIYNLEHKLTQSFVHLVSESKSHSYYPFITEKFLYSIITRGLFVTYGQPHWHSHVEKYYGFKKYDKIFDYSFDEIKNPMERVVSLISMVHKFSLLSVDDWNDLYQMESDTIEYNYDHYFSNGYLKQMRKYE